MNWSIIGLRGTREGVTKAIVEETKLPQAAKDFILAEIALMPECLGFAVDGFCQEHPAGAGSTLRGIQISIVALR